jgi:RNA polymerase-interacting CarD/CdnL/TRCF family regulator
MNNQRDLEFSVGDRVTVPAYPPGTITAIEMQTHDGEEIEMYVIDFEETPIRVCVSTVDWRYSGLCKV